MADKFTSGVGMVQLLADSVEVRREVVEVLALIIGPNSAAAAALARADEYEGPVKFWHSPSVQMLSVEMLPKESSEYDA